MRLSKKIFIFSSTALLVVLFFGGIYYFLFAPPKEALNRSQSSETPEEKKSILENISLPKLPSSEEKIEAVSDESILAPTLTPNGQFVRYYSKTTGNAFELDFFTEEKKTLSAKNLQGLKSVSWSPDTTKTISEFSTGENSSKFSLYDYVQKKDSPLNENISAVSWQNNGKIIYQYSDLKNASLNVADPDGSDWHKLADVPTKKLIIAPIPMSGLISFWNRPDSFSETFLQSVSPLSKEKKDLIKGYFGADFLWSPDGSMILESTVDKKGGSRMQLGVTNSSGQDYRSLGIPTLVTKCAWSKDSRSVYCAQPTSIPENAIMPNDYQEQKFTTNDTFWKIDVSTGEKTRLVDLKEIKAAYDATSLFLSSNESLLFFINRVDGKLYRITL